MIKSRLTNTLLKKSLISIAMLTSLSSFAATRWDMATPYVDATHHTQNVIQFAKDVKEATNGELEIVVHSGASLIKHTEIARAVRTQQVPIGEVFIGILGNSDPIYKLDNIPFLATNFEQAKALYAASKSTLEKKLDKDGMMLLYSVPWPPQGIYSKNPINSIDDLKGGKMRAYSPTLSRLSVLLGAIPTTVQTVEIPQAFSTGIIDMMMTSPTTGVSSQSWDYLKNYTDVQAWIPKNMVIVNKRAFKRLPKDVQTSLLSMSEKAENRGWDMAIKETAEKTQMLADKGINVSKPSAKLMSSLKAVGDVMTKEWAEEASVEDKIVLADYQEQQ
ncbi:MULTISPECIES: TRAP transporter substrate-binding protein [Vibrio]|uniref:C4-dicarboxylate ABC transporter substrate-binding protein n=2 Tax=Vibrio casei TaxID=673372 RepID=A0A368LGY2_9VIBR|nr:MULTISPECIES: TRAP transporter substrate-binding protein [Vibrio]RCS70012.1 C4-dicarboxylate ABC transporter substrate-binding protein [Vibrio casei]SJN33767.1 TRAP transporter solute receptor, unknown substrate 5 [Vibrio casei]HBV77461.1 C4-dicarboxylate ABC transporter substrate-binding protein [Vibrio sp.]